MEHRLFQEMQKAPSPSESEALLGYVHFPMKHANSGPDGRALNEVKKHDIRSYRAHIKRQTFHERFTASSRADNQETVDNSNTE
ncbi:MAG: hypothetical protein AAF490_07930 [Chloroflexota bacterium]